MEENKQMIKYHETECPGIKIVQNFAKKPDFDSFIILANRQLTVPMSLAECKLKLKSRDLDLLVNIAFAAVHIVKDWAKEQNDVKSSKQ